MFNKYFFVLLGLIVFTSCKKEDIKSKGTAFDQFTWTENPCEEGNTGSVSFDGVAGIHCRYPVFNPSNILEFVYYEYEYDTVIEDKVNPKLIKYNWGTSEKTVLLEGMKISGPATWSKKGKIAFNKFQTSEIYTINDDGSNLNLDFTISPTAYAYGKWDEEGDVLYWLMAKTDAEDNIIHYLLKKNYRLNKVDTILMPNTVYNMDISSKNELLNFTGNGYYEMISLSNKTPSADLSQLESGMFLWSGLTFNNEGDKFYASIMKYETEAIYEVDIAKNEATVVFKGCQKGFIEHISVSPWGDYILMDKRGLEEHSSAYEIWILDLKEKKESLVVSGG